MKIFIYPFTIINKNSSHFFGYVLTTLGILEIANKTYLRKIIAVFDETRISIGSEIFLNGARDRHIKKKKNSSN